MHIPFLFGKGKTDQVSARTARIEWKTARVSGKTAQVQQNTDRDITRPARVERKTNRVIARPAQVERKTAQVSPRTAGSPKELLYRIHFLIQETSIPLKSSLFKQNGGCR